MFMIYCYYKKNVGKNMDHLSLREYIYRNNLLVKEFADKIGVNKVYFSSCLTGSKPFSKRVAFKIRELTNGEIDVTKSKNIGKK